MQPKTAISGEEKVADDATEGEGSEQATTEGGGEAQKVKERSTKRSNLYLTRMQRNELFIIGVLLRICILYLLLTNGCISSS